MITLSYGYQQPQNPDTGDVVFPALETNWQQVNNHNHDGVTSALLSVSTANVLAASWAAAPIGGGVYRQSVTMPAGRTFDATEISFRISTGEFVYPTVEKIDSTHYYVYTNDNTLAYVARYR